MPPAIGQFVKTVMSQHTQHAAAWNSLLTGAGKKAVTVTDPALTPTVDQQLAQVTTLTQVAQLALMLENTAAQTYQAEASKLKSAKAVSVAATIQPVEMQHAAILYYVLGEYPGIQDSVGQPAGVQPHHIGRLTASTDPKDILMLAAIEGPDILIVLAVVLLLFGSTQIPKLARSLGSASREFKHGQDHEPLARDAGRGRDADRRPAGHHGAGRHHGAGHHGAGRHRGTTVPVVTAPPAVAAAAPVGNGSAPTPPTS